MRIETKKLYDFIKKSTMNGSIPTTYIEISKEGLKSKVKDISNICLTEVILNKEIFNEEMYGKVYVKNAKMFMDVLKTFGEEVELSKIDDYTLSIKGDDVKRKADIIMGSDLIVDNIIEGDVPNIPTVRDFLVEKKVLSKVLSDVSLLKINEITIQTDNNRLLFTVGSEKESDVLSTYIDIESGEDVKVSIGAYMKDLNDSFETNSQINIKLANNVPAVFEEQTEDMKFTCIIAPIVHS